MKKNKGKLVEGALIGAVLGVAAGMFLASETGKKLEKKAGKNIKKLSGEFYRYLSPQVKKLKRMGQEEFNAFVQEGAKKFAKVKQLSLQEEKNLAMEAKRTWGHIKKHFR
ncbi:MAG: YtxH domain-containing protein [bacterium]|nr:YtxH domain-containing protein [bacterium]